MIREEVHEERIPLLARNVAAQERAAAKRGCEVCLRADLMARKGL